ncbi:MAG: acyl transferase [Bacteroidota bacterium]
MIQIPDFFTIRTRLTEDPDQFGEIALQVFQYQYENNEIYRAFCQLIGVFPEQVDEYRKIPFLPISFFKSQAVTCFEPIWAERIYTSSATTGSVQSRHYVRKYINYRQSFEGAFEQFYGTPSDWCILALLPNYLEREGSSLVEMARDLIDDSRHPDSGFYLNNLDELVNTIHRLVASGTRILLLGVTYALLDLAELGPFDWNSVVIMETGGMKGRRKELIREELHTLLNTAFNTSSIHSEYGMTELLSQGYSPGNGIFYCPPWMKIVMRDTHDPLSLLSGTKTGGINVIDLANIDSCSFIATQDLGKVYGDGSFEVLGRFDNSDIRGCNLMVS